MVGIELIPAIIHSAIAFKECENELKLFLLFLLPIDLLIEKGFQERGML